MKKIAIFGLIIGTTLSILSGCKKGADDPFLSLRSRDKRITGDWVLAIEDVTTKRTVTTTVTDSNGDQASKNVSVSTEISSYSGSSKTVKMTDQTTTTVGSTTTTTTTTMEERYSLSVSETLGKDHIISNSWVETLTYYKACDTCTAITDKEELAQLVAQNPWDFENRNESSENAGTWTWADARKNKIFIMGDFIWGDILQLKDKELVLQGNFITKNTDSSFDSFDESTSVTITDLNVAGQQTWTKE